MWELISRKYPVFQFLGTSINLQNSNKNKYSFYFFLIWAPTANG